MQTSFAPIDHLKVSWLLEEAIQKLLFLSKIIKEDGTSSELAGYEINKLLSEQGRLEETYAELLKVRTTLKGISNKRKLEEIQKEIHQIAHALKENTKKLGRLFRENPSFEKDAEKVSNEKAELVEKLESIINAHSQNFSIVSLQTNLIDDLEAQDSLRKLSLKEKSLLYDIKQLHAAWKKEEEEYQNITGEKQAHIQKMKEELAREKASAGMETKYKANELEAFEGTLTRIQSQRLIDLQKKIEECESKKLIENQAFNKIRIFLKNKEEQNKVNIQEWSEKSEGRRTELEAKIEELSTRKEKALGLLEKLKEDFDERDKARKEKERISIEKEAEKQSKLDHELKVEEAVRAIQEKYIEWKEAGGTVKKTKKGAKSSKKKG